MAQQPFISAMPHHLTALAFFLQAAAAWPWDPTVKVPGLGVVEGYTTADVTTFNRVPYAQPPLGSLRFRAPVSVRPWSGTFDAKGSVPLCPQIKLSKSVPIAHLGQEDCLYLSIVVPPKAHTEPAPVLFWIYGGAYILGDVSEFGWYDATTLAKTTGAIVVSVNYRVGPFGFLAHQALQAEDPDRSTGNMGVRDQQEALRWVRDHISAFGGDPAHVTIFGQSAGGISVCWHLAAPLSRGLFHAAIAESATCDTPDFFLKAADQLSFGAMYAEDKFGCAATLNQTSWLDCARRASVGDIMNGVMSWFGPNWPGSSDLDLTKARFPTGLFHSFANIAMGNTLPFLAPMFPFGPVIDGTKQGTPELPLTALQQGRANYVPTIFGTTKDEGSIFVPMLAVVVPNATWPISGDTDVQTALHHFFPSQMVAKVMLLYTLADYSGSQEQRMAAILRDYIFACPSRRAARAVDTHLPHKSWLYHFEYPMHWAEKSLGNYHTSELYYLFGTKGPELKDVPLVHDFNAHDRTMSATFQRLWGNMARWQTPNGQAADGNVFWPNHNASDDMNIVLTVPPAPQVGLYRDKCDFWDTHMASVAEGGARRQVLQRVLHRARNTSNGGSLQALSV